MTMYALTTIDNPYDPFDDFKNWFTFDVLNQYNTCERLARTAIVNDLFSDSECDSEIERAIDSIVDSDLENIYVKVSKDG